METEKVGEERKDFFPAIDYLNPEEVIVVTPKVTCTVVLSDSLEIFSASELFLHRLGYSFKELSHWNLGSFLFETQKYQFKEFLSQTRTDSRLEIENIGLRREDGGLEWFDMTAVKMSTGHIIIGMERTRSTRDFMTGLYNLPSFIFLGNQAIEMLFRDRLEIVKSIPAETARIEKPISLCFLMMDIDSFKLRINDLLGASVGDQAIVIVADAIKSVFGRAAEYKGRLGGDEFGVLLWKGYSLEDIETKCRQLESSIFDRWVSLGYRVELSITMGIVFFDPYLYGKGDDLPTTTNFRDQAKAMIGRLKEKKGIRR